jgi:hypothetical protein
VLDACVLNADGQARIVVGEQAASALLPHWRGRHGVLDKLANGILQKYNKVQSVAEQHTDKAIAGWSKGDPFPVTVDLEAKTVAWDCKRTGRLCDPYARAMLARFSHHFARDAYLQDLARQ